MTKLGDVAASVALPAVVRPNLSTMFEKLAENPNIDVDKLEKLMQMQERILAQDREAEFNAAFSAMQGALQAVRIPENGRGHNGVKYATHEDIQDTIRPVLARHGFSLSFRTEFPEKASVKITAVLAHGCGHSISTDFLSAADTSGNKNAIQALGSTVSYGKRYTTNALLNLTSREEKDDDGAASGGLKPEAPKDYQAVLDDLETAAETGTKGFGAAWDHLKKNRPQIAQYAQKFDRDVLERLKQKAQKADGGQR